MTDNELLLAISNIVQSHTEPIKQSVQDMEEHLGSELFSLKKKFSTLESDVSVLKTDISALKTNISALKTNVSALENESRHTQLLLENEVLPRLQNIESCYTTTYQRYANGVLQLDSLQCDVDILKNVVAEHSEILQKIS